MLHFVIDIPLIQTGMMKETEMDTELPTWITAFECDWYQALFSTLLS